ncbi:MAG TPA: hypothetical protein VII36_00570 [Usitatibacter sp.]
MAFEDPLLRTALLKIIGINFPVIVVGGAALIGFVAGEMAWSKQMVE